MATAKAERTDAPAVEVIDLDVERIRRHMEGLDTFMDAVMSAFNVINTQLANIEGRIQSLQAMPGPIPQYPYQPQQMVPQAPPQAPVQPAKSTPPTADLLGDIAGTAAAGVGGPLAGKLADQIVDKLATRILDRIGDKGDSDG